MEQGKPFKVDESRDKNNDYTKIIDFWRYIEIFTPQDFTPPKDIVNCKSCKLDLEKLPWNYLKEKEKDGEKCRRYHTIYLGIFKGQKLIDFLDKKFIDKNNPLPEQRIDSSQKASVSFRVSPEGILDTSSLFISNCAWAIGQLEKDNDLNNHNYEGFESLKADILNCLTDEEKTKPIDKNTLQKLIDCFKEKLGSFDMLECPNNHHVVSIRYENEPTDTDDFLNSFYIEDLERVKNDMSNIKEGGLRRFLGNQLGEEDKVDVRNFNSWEDYYEYLKPEMYPPSCWPAKGHYPLVFSQQIAINNIYKKLLNSSGIYSVNGPPGTGKTTLLRDLIASIVTYRAELLSKYDKPADAFEPVEHECELCGEKMEVRAGKNGKFIGCSGFPKCTNTKNINSPKVVWKLDEDKYSTNFWPYKDALIDHSIVVASNNNGAVENITKELPEVGAIDDSWVGEGSCYKDLDFFRQVSNQIIGQETWALFCAPLGNSENRKKFTQFFVLAKADENKQDDATTNILEEIDKIDIDWGEAKKRYKKAKEQVEKIRKEKCKDFDEYFKCQDQLKTNNEKLNTLKEQKGSLESEVEGLKNKVKELNTEKEEASKALQELEEALKAKNQDYEKQNQLLKKLKEDTNIHNGDIDKHYSRKPGLLDWIVTLGKSHKRWNQTLVELEEDFKKKKGEELKQSQVVEHCLNLVKELKGKIENQKATIDDIQKKIIYVESEILDRNKNIATVEEEIKKFQKIIQKLIQECKNYINKFNTIFKTDKETDREKSNPFMDKQSDWQQARAKLFFESLLLHKAFIGANKDKFKTNIHTLIKLLSGKAPKNLSSYIAKQIWGTLFFFTPVASTTFASMGRLFRHLGREQLGWLLIDEAGQATPQSAVGSIWRAKRTVVVGDPLQLEPVVTLPVKAQELLRNKMNVDSRYMPQYTSVQVLADACQPIGTYLNKDDTRTWVGSPLRVHRRCDSPMFDIANKIAYDGLMIQGKDASESNLPQSCWIHVKANLINNNSHWIVEEGEETKKLIVKLKQLDLKKEDFFVISPFTSVVEELKKCLNEYVDPIRVGTIHTTQGKEARVVIMVLGGSTDGARQWAASKPNLLNVALTRAKERFYVVGNKDEWGKKEYFDKMKLKLEENLKK